MSANFPPGVADNTADSTGRTGAVGRGTYDEAKSTAKQAGATLRSDLANLKNDLDVLMARAATLSERELSDAYANMMMKFSSLRYAAKGVAAEAGRQFNQGVDMTSDYVKERPLQSVAIATGFGLVVGLMLGRR